MTTNGVRLAELLGGLSLACDVADGFPLEKVLRTVVLAVELGRRQGLGAETLRDVYYTTLLRYAGCTAFSHEEAHRYGAGDDIQTRSVMALADLGDPLGTLRRVALGIGQGAGLLERGTAVARLLGDRVAIESHARSQCEVSRRMAELVGASASVHAALAHICERFDGRGHPAHLEGEALALPMRVAHLADVAEIVHHRSGRDAARDTVRRRSGGHFDPSLCRLFEKEADSLFDLLERPGVWDAFLAAEPAPFATASGQRLDDVALAFAQFADLKSSFTLGHSTAVADLAVRAAAAAGLGAQAASELRVAALLHDIGRVGTPNRIWDKPGALTRAEWEQVRMHTYWTERIVCQASPWQVAARLAAGAHERIDGAGYHRGTSGSGVSLPARLLAAADSYRAMTEPRPHRPALPRATAARTLREEAAAGRLDLAAANAVLDAASGAAISRPSPGRWPRALTDREVQVLRLLARGRSNKEIGAALQISARTAQHHVIHIYQKIEVSSRAAAALFATEHQLLEE